jgi:predicted RNA-binding Zn-ribbon protein involved in translation (DUF1610 family)
MPNPLPDPVPDPLSVPFDCPNCGAKYEIVRVESPSQWTADRDIKCVSCGGSLRGRHGVFVLKYFLVERPRRRGQKAINTVTRAS